MSEDVQSGNKESSGDTALFAELNAICNRLLVLADTPTTKREITLLFDEIVKHIHVGRYRKFSNDKWRQEQREPRLHPIALPSDSFVQMADSMFRYESELTKILPDVPVSSRDELDLQIKNGFRRPQLQEDESNESNA